MCYLYEINDFHARKTIRVPEKLRRETARGGSPLVRLTGVEPAHMASEATALSTELQAHIITLTNIIAQTLEIFK